MGWGRNLEAYSSSASARSASYPSLAGRKVIVSGGGSVIPGNLQTPRQMKWYSPDGGAEIFAAQCLVGRIQPDDIAAMALFPASDDARYCTAHNYWVDARWR